MAANTDRARLIGQHMARLAFLSPSAEEDPSSGRLLLSEEALAAIVAMAVQRLFDVSPSEKRYRMTVEFVHHAMSGHGGDAEVRAIEDPNGGWRKV